MPLIGSIVTWPPPSAIPTSKLSVILQPIASVSLVPTSSAIPFLNDWRGLRRAFQVFLVLFVIFCESTGKHLFKIGNSFRSVCHSEIPSNLRQLQRVMFMLFRSLAYTAAKGSATTSALQGNGATPAAGRHSPDFRFRRASAGAGLPGLARSRARSASPSASLEGRRGLRAECGRRPAGGAMLGVRPQPAPPGRDTASGSVCVCAVPPGWAPGTGGDEWAQAFRKRAAVAAGTSAGLPARPAAEERVGRSGRRSLPLGGRTGAGFPNGAPPLVGTPASPPGSPEARN